MEQSTPQPLHEFTVEDYARTRFLELARFFNQPLMRWEDLDDTQKSFFIRTQAPVEKIKRPRPLPVEVPDTPPPANLYPPEPPRDWFRMLCIMAIALIAALGSIVAVICW